MTGGSLEEGVTHPYDTGLYLQLYPSAYASVYAEARGIWGMLPGMKMFWNFCCEMASEAILGPKTSLLILAFVLAWYHDSDSLQVYTHGDKWPSAVSRTSDARKPVRILLVLS